MAVATEAMVVQAERRSCTLHVHDARSGGPRLRRVRDHARVGHPARRGDLVDQRGGRLHRGTAGGDRGTTRRCDNPYGRLALENLYALFRSLMILGVVIVGLVTNAVKVIDYLVTGEGSEPEFGVAAVYTAVCVLICLALKWNHERHNRAVGGASALLRVEATAAKMEAIISGGICASLVVVTVIPEGTVVTSADFNIKDIADSIIVLILCVLLIGEPVRQIRLEFGRLSGRRADPDLDAAVRDAVSAVDAAHAHELDHELTLVDALAISRGKTIEIDLRVSYAGTMSVAEQDELRAHTYQELRDRIGPLRLTLVFSDLPIHAVPTLDRRQA